MRRDAFRGLGRGLLLAKRLLCEVDMLISSLQNPRIKALIRLRERRERDRKGLFLIEGFRELFRASKAGQPIEALFACPEFFLGEGEGDLIDSLGGELFFCTKQVFQKISYRDRPDGLLAVAPQMRQGLADLEARAPSFFLVAEAIEKPGNLGTILRSADAAGVEALILCDRCTDLYNPNVVRASTGILFSLPVVEASSGEALSWLKERGVKIIASTPSAERLYTEIDLTGPIALAVGTEQLGLSSLWIEQADLKARIPMKGSADSLNVATATTVFLYEAVRQRGHSV